MPLTLLVTIGITIAYGILVIGEKLGDKPMPDDMKLWFLSLIAAAGLLTCVVLDLQPIKKKESK